jgi:hypothetical protein
MFYEYIKAFQSGLVGILGFIGVIITLWGNARLAERKRLRERDEERQTLRSALRQELTSIREELLNINRIVNQTPPTPVHFTLEEPYVYRTLVKDIGTLGPETARRVIRVYRDVHLVTNVLRSLASNPENALAAIEKKFPEPVADLVERILHQLEVAIEELK